MPLPSPHYLRDLTAEQRARLETDADLCAAFEAGLAPFLPKPVGVHYSGSGSEAWVPVAAVFANSERAVRFARRGQAEAA